MPLELSWKEIGVRLVLAAFASACVGANRDERGRPAGLRTTMLVCLAATLAMIQVNLLLSLRGKAGDNFNTLDLMRLPLGILSGIGFIGAGTILKRGETALGVTTAATLWYVTVLGLLFGGGQLGVGATAALAGLFILTVVKRVERRIVKTHRGTLTLAFSQPGIGEADLRERLGGQGFRIDRWKVSLGPRPGVASLACVLEWHAPGGEPPGLPAGISELRDLEGVTLVEWEQ